MSTSKQTKFVITGQASLSGEIQVLGAKNEALKALALSLLMEAPFVIRHVPEIEDVARMIEILRAIGVTLTAGVKGDYSIDSTRVTSGELPNELVSRLRASVVLVGPLLARWGDISFAHPGGCAIGQRPIDFFIDGFRTLGADVEVKNDHYRIRAKKLRGGEIIFPVASMTGTETFAMTATQISGTTIIHNAARDPEVVHLLEYMVASGAHIEGIGTGTLRIVGPTPLVPPGPYEVIPDRIEAGSFLALAAATRSTLKITGCNPDHLVVPIATLRRMGVDVEADGTTIHVRPGKKLLSVPIVTREYPGFPTDVLAPFIILATQSAGETLIHETIYESRLFFIDKLNRMGAKVLLCDPHRALVMGPTPLFGASIESPDIRAGLALIIAGLMAEGTTTIGNAYQIDRGYERIDERLRALGAKIERVE